MIWVGPTPSWITLKVVRQSPCACLSYARDCRLRSSHTNGRGSSALFHWTSRSRSELRKIWEGIQEISHIIVRLRCILTYGRGFPLKDQYSVRTSGKCWWRTPRTLTVIRYIHASCRRVVHRCKSQGVIDEANCGLSHVTNFSLPSSSPHGNMCL